MSSRALVFSLCALAGWTALGLAQAPGDTASAPSTTAGKWKLEFYTDLNVPTGTPFEEVGSLNRATTAAMAGRPAAQLPKAELLRRKLEGGFGGISALAFDAGSGTLYALSDAAVPVFFTMTASIEGRELHLVPGKAVFLTSGNGERIGPWILDPEGIAVTPWGSLLISSEGYTGRRPPVDPAIVEFGKDGRRVRDLPVPDKFLRKGGERQTAGVRHNLGFEGLSVSPGGTRVFAATEGPLVQDGERCGIENGCQSRIIEYGVNGRSANPIHEYSYPVSAMPLPGDMTGARGNMGVSDVLALNDNELLVLERGFASVGDTGKNLQRVRIYHVDLRSAPDVSGVASLNEQPQLSLKKTLLLDLDKIAGDFTQGYRKLDNYEGICFGPALPGGGRSILLTSDNNFQEAQRTSFVVLRLVQR